MPKYWHSVRLDGDACKGCTNCIRLCPTQAIRVQNGKAKIIKERCIDCGECIRVCPYHAKKAVCDSFDLLNGFKYNIALPAPAFIGQFSKAKSVDTILTGLKMLGFDHIFEVARGAELVTRKTLELLEGDKLQKPVISSACPAVIRFITVRFPNLIDNILPIKAPVEIAAKIARDQAVKRTGLTPDEIGVFFISPCPAKVTAVKSPLVTESSEISGVFSIKDTYTRMAHKVGNLTDITTVGRAPFESVLWATSGGEASALNSDNYIAVDGIHNLLRVFEELEDEKIRNIDYIEALACVGGCVGGALTVENNFVAGQRIKSLAKKIVAPKYLDMPESGMLWDKNVVYRPILNLDDDVKKAIEKKQHMEQIISRLPQLDCGSCGAPSCQTLAEDIVRGYATETDCIFKLRERVSEIAKEMIDLEKHLSKIH